MPWRLRSMFLWLAGGVLIAAGFGVLTLPGGSPASAQGPTISFDPDDASILVDDTIDVEITISEVTNLYSASVHVTFDPTLLEVVDADPARDGVQIFPGAFPGPSEGPGDITTNVADNLDGTIDYDFTLLDPAPPAEGSGTLATIRFMGKDYGVSSLTIAAAALWDPYNDPIEAETVDGTLEVDDAPTDTPTPTATPTITETPSSATPTRTATTAPTSTGTPRPTSTPQPEETEEEEEEEPATAQPPQAPLATLTPQPSGAAAPVSANATPQDLPSAGDPALPTQLWRWFFLFGAVILGLATWAFGFRFYARQKEHERFWHGT